MEILQTLEFRIEGQRTYLRKNWSMIFVNGAMTNCIFRGVNFKTESGFNGMLP